MKPKITKQQKENYITTSLTTVRNGLKALMKKNISYSALLNLLRNDFVAEIIF